MTIEIRLWNEETMQYELHSTHPANTVNFLTDVQKKMTVERVSVFPHTEKIIVWGTAVRP